MIGHARARAAIALATVIYFLAVIGLMISGSLLLASGARRSSSILADDALLIGAAEGAVARIVAPWDGERRAAQPIGAAATETSSLTTRPAVDVATTVVRLSRVAYWVAARAAARGRVGRRRVALLVRLVGTLPPATGAVIARGDVVVGPDATLVGGSGDTGPDGCTGGDDASAPLVVVADSSSVRASLPPGSGTADSVHWIRASWAEDVERYAPFGKDSWGVAAAQARVSFGDGEAVRLDPALGPGIARADGDLTIEGGAWRGILLVGGRLRVVGPFDFEGMVVARGGIDLDADGIEIRGLIMSAGVPDGSGAAGRDSVVLRRAAVVRRSWCAALRAFAASAPVRPLRGRAWMELLEAR